MNWLKAYCLIFSLFISCAHPAIAQVFSSGSDGSYGPINISTNETLQTPPDGVFHATTVFVASNAVLSFAKNPLNTPIYLLASGAVVINGTIDVSGGSVTSLGVPGQSGPGGFRGGLGGGSGVLPGDGHGPGGGLAGGNAPDQTGNGVPGAFAENATSFAVNSNVYGNSLLVPLIGGSGGGGSGAVQNYTSGGGGGGALLLASDDSVVLSGQILALGGHSLAPGGRNIGAGSGGAIRIVVPSLQGNGIIDTRVRSFYNSNNSRGRIRLDVLAPIPPGLTMYGRSTSGTFMQTRPPLPKLEIISVDGSAVVPNSQSLIPLSTPANTTVQVRATGFRGIVPIQIALTPDSGSRSIIDHNIDMAGNSSASATINVTLAGSILYHLHVWTKP